MPNFQVMPKELKPISETTFGAEGIMERNDIQRMLREQISVVDDRLMVIAEEFDQLHEALAQHPGEGRVRMGLVRCGEAGIIHGGVRAIGHGPACVRMAMGGSSDNGGGTRRARLRRRIVPSTSTMRRRRSQPSEASSASAAFFCRGVKPRRSAAS